MRKSYGILGVVLVLLCSILVGCDFSLANAKYVTVSVTNNLGENIDLKLFLSNDPTDISDEVSSVSDGGKATLELNMVNISTTGDIKLTCTAHGKTTKTTEVLGTYTNGSPSDNTINVTITYESDKPVITVDGD